MPSLPTQSASSSVSSVLVGIGAVGLVTLALLSPVHNDTWWHLAYGREMATRGGFAQADWFSWTAYGQPFPNHQWLGERVLYGLMAAGGLPLLTLGCALAIVGGWSVSWTLSRGAVIDRLALMAGAVGASTLVWSIRPQVFTVLLFPVIVRLLVRERLLWIPPLIGLWANLHGGVTLGVVAVAVSVVVAAIWDRTRLAPRLACLSASMLLTLATPLGMRYWPEIIASLRRSQVNHIQEWSQTALPPQHLLFWSAACALLVLAVRRWRSLSAPGCRVLAAVAIVLLPAGVRTLRNVPAFMMVAAPAISVLVFANDRRRGQERVSWPPRTMVPVVLAAAVAAFLVARAWSTPWARLEWQPISAGAIAAVRRCPDPIYNSYVDGGPLIWFVPERRVFLDSRQDQYPRPLVQEATRVEATGDYNALFARHRIACAVLSAGSPVGAALRRDGWREQYADEQWLVMTR